ncbi:MAG: ion transporter [Plesiomonas sp.]
MPEHSSLQHPSSSPDSHHSTPRKYRHRLYNVVFNTQRRSGRIVELVLLFSVLLSVAVLIIGSTLTKQSYWYSWFIWCEIGFSIIFSLEYLLRLYCSPKPLRYASSFYGIVDLLSILPVYLSLLFPGLEYTLMLRLLRMFRLFRILKLVRYMSEANLLWRCLIQTHRKVLVFFGAVGLMVCLFGSIMFVVEGPQNGFTSIPMGIYWAIVTLTTVGYGDLVPHTPLGRVIASLVILIGYSIIAVPTGILTAQLTEELQKNKDRLRCDHCHRTGHDADALHCKFCGAALPKKR